MSSVLNFKNILELLPEIILKTKKIFLVFSIILGEGFSVFLKFNIELIK